MYRWSRNWVNLLDKYQGKIYLVFSSRCWKKVFPHYFKFMHNLQRIKSTLFRVEFWAFWPPYRSRDQHHTNHHTQNWLGHCFRKCQISLRGYQSILFCSSRAHQASPASSPTLWLCTGRKRNGLIDLIFFFFYCNKHLLTMYSLWSWMQGALGNAKVINKT